MPVLRGLLLNPDRIYDAEHVAKALAELGGAAEGEFLRGLLAADAEPVVEVAVEALGRMRYLPAAPDVSALRAPAASRPVSTPARGSAGRR